MRKHAKTLTKTRGFRWFLRLLIPALILGIHWALGISFGQSLLLFFGYVAGGAMLLCPTVLLLPLGLLLSPILLPIFRLYGLRDSLPDRSQVRSSIKWACRLFLASIVVGFLFAGFSLALSSYNRAGCFLLAAIVACYLVFWEVLANKPRWTDPGHGSDSEGSRCALSECVGAEGVVVTALRPVGRVRLDGAVYDAVAEGEFVDKDSMVRVVGFSVGQLKVRLVDGVDEQDADSMTNRRGVIICVICIGLAVCFCGCADSLVDLTKTGQVTVETVSGEKTKILWAKVYQDGDDTLIKVALRRRLPTAYPLKTHVDIVVIAPNGEMSLETRTENIYVPRNVPGKGPNVKFFRKVIPGTLPQNSTVRIECR